MADGCGLCGWPIEDGEVPCGCYYTGALSPDSVTPATDCEQSGVSTVCDESPVTQTVENGDTV